MTTGPLAGVTIAITRPETRAAALAAAMYRAGARVVFAPSIDIRPPVTFDVLDTCIARLESYQWLVFTSVAAIDALSRRLSETNVPVQQVHPGVRIAVVGRTTANAATQVFGRVDHVGGGNAESLAETLPLQPADRVLFVCSDRAHDVLPAILAERGAIMERAVGYRTVSIDAATYADCFKTNDVDFAVVCSPSSAEVLGNVLRIDGARVPAVVCIGTTTAAAATAVGLQVVGIASDPSDDALLAATMRAATTTKLDENGSAYPD